MLRLPCTTAYGMGLCRAEGSVAHQGPNLGTFTVALATASAGENTETRQIRGAKICLRRGGPPGPGALIADSAITYDWGLTTALMGQLSRPSAW